MDNGVVTEEAASSAPRTLLTELGGDQKSPPKNISVNDSKLIFEPLAWAKLMALRDYHPSLEIGVWGYTPEHPLHISDLIITRQTVSGTSQDFDMTDVGVYQLLLEKEHQIPPHQWLSVWIHTHPFASCKPSTKDETTWENLFSDKAYGLMVIVASNDSVYCRIGMRVEAVRPLYVEGEIPTVVPAPRYWGMHYTPANVQLWRSEYDALVTPTVERKKPTKVKREKGSGRFRASFDWEKELGMSEDDWTEYDRARGCVLEQTLGPIESTALGNSDDALLRKLEKETNECRKFLGLPEEPYSL